MFGRDVPIVIEVYGTYLTITSETWGEVRRGIYITKVLDKLKTSVFDFRKKKWHITDRFYMYDRDNYCFRLPRNALSVITETLDNQLAKYEIKYMDPIKSDPIKFKIHKKFEARDYQETVIEHLLKNAPIACTDMATGSGKTLLSLFTISKLQLRTLIICDGLTDQWKKVFTSSTSLKDDENDIFVIKGAGSLRKLYKKKYKPKIFISSIDTLRNYIKYDKIVYGDLPTYEEFLEEFGIGIKFIDEFHLNFKAIKMIDLVSNCKYNFYLSATPKRSLKDANRIFKIMFPDDIIFGKKITAERYTNVTMYSYNLITNSDKKFTTVHGYAHTKYELMILNNNNFKRYYFENIIKSVIDQYYINKFDNGKLLILMSTVAMCDAFKEFLSTMYQKDVRTYVSDDPEENLDEADIIISTPGSCGVGRDIANLVCCINTISVNSAPLVEQILGRLRKLKDGRTPEFVDIFNRWVIRHQEHARNRARIYRTRALNYEEIEAQ